VQEPTSKTRAKAADTLDNLFMKFILNFIF
jgi:hypothetical protein